eukprot:scaffold218742_cov10-Tisochrysis_lutea.AAC.1
MSPCKTHIVTVAQIQAKHSKVNAKSKIALNRLRLPGRQHWLTSPKQKNGYILHPNNHCLQKH